MAASGQIPIAADRAGLYENATELNDAAELQFGHGVEERRRLRSWVAVPVIHAFLQITDDG